MLKSHYSWQVLTVGTAVATLLASTCTVSFGNAPVPVMSPVVSTPIAAAAVEAPSSAPGLPPLPTALPALPQWSANRALPVKSTQTLEEATPALQPTTTEATQTSPALSQPASSPDLTPASSPLQAWTAKPISAGKLDLVHDIPLEISGYPGVPSSIANATDALTWLNDGTSILVRMEVLRRADTNLSLSEKDKLLADLKKRHDLQPNNPHRYFDHGYAQFVMKNNQSGLYYLRKANDTLKNQFVSLAYAMAQADVDMTLENSAPDQYTTRKQDVGYKLKDAVALDAQRHQPGFWPSFVKVLQTLKSAPAYADVVNRDYSDLYVPYGNRSVFATQAKADASYSMMTVAANAKDDKTITTLSNQDSCAAAPNTAVLSGATLTGRQTLNLLKTPCPQIVQTFKRADTNWPYQVVVLEPGGTVIADFLSRMPHRFFEDLDGDNVFEIVLRQYSHDPYQPIHVYRFANGHFALDQSVDNLFR